MTILLHDPATEEPGGEAVFVLPASYAQQRLWFLDQLEPGSPLYNIPLALRLTGPLDAGALAEALGGIVRRHEALRTTLAVEDGQVVQVVASPGSWQLPRIGLESFAPAERRAAARRLAAEEAVRPFDLARGPLFRAVLLDLGVLDGSAEHLLCLNLHHAIADGWSLGIFQRELAALYRARRAAPGGQTGPAPLAELPIQYGDYAAWQREELQGSALEGHLAWWRERLGDAPRLMELPLARPRPAARDHRGEQRSLALPPELAGRLKAICQREGVTRFMILLAAFAALLHRTTGQTDLVIGTPLAGREQLDTEGVIGLFANVVALRIGLGGGELTFRGLLSRVRESFLGAHAHQDLPFERLVEELQPERSLSHPPLVQVLFTFHESSPLAAPSLPGLRVEPVELHTGTVKLDLGLSCEERGTALLARLDYAADLLDGVDALRLLLSLGALLGGVAADPGRRLAELPVTTEEGLHQLLAEWNDTAAPFRRELCLHERFAAQAARTPRAVAVGWGEERISYAALARRASRLARRLRRLGVGPESRVGVALERTPRLVAALLAVLEAGGAYVPLDPAYPRERLAFILADAQEGQARPVLLAERPVLERLPAFAGAVVCLDEEDEADDDEEDGEREDEERAPAGGAVAGNLAYLIYTSGSTGRPKGVAIEHRSAAALLDWAAGVFPLPPAGDLSRVLAATSITFDLSVFELFLPLTTGGTVVLAEDALALPRLPMAGEVRLVNTVPSALAALVRTGGLPAAVRTVNLAGEPLKRALVDEIHALPGVARVFNLYGPSEDTTYSTWALVPRGDRREPTIGMPIANTRAYVVDPWLGPLPAGVAGELCLGGEGLARGYLNRPELTAEKFVPDPFGGSLAGAAGGRLYRTGDLARRRADGELEFLGRIDHQVKVRGFRIELGEIEAALCAHPQVREAVVLAREDTPGDPRLVAYVEPVGSGMLPADLRARLAERLPGYMIPAAFVALAALPRTPNGKVDRKALPAPEWRGEDAQPVAPRTPTEELLTGIWGAVLRRPAVGVREDFFALGGHSLLATQVVSRVREVCGVEVPLRRLFAAPTVEGLAAAVEEARRQRQAGTAGPVPPVVPVPRDGDPAASFAQERLWFLDRMGEGGTAYNLPVALCLRGGLDPLKVTALAAALSEVARRHEALRTTFRAYGSGRPGVAQVIAPPGPVPLPVVDLRRLPDAAAAGRRLAAAVAGRRFDLERGPLLRALLLRLADEDHTLVLAMHHIVSDGWSMGVLVREVAALYDAFAAGRPSPLPELAVQYADFAAWQRERLQGEALAAQLAFWRAALAGLPPVLDLPTDRPRPAVRGGRSGRLAFRVPAGAAVQGCARGAGATLFMALLAAFQTLLARWSGSDDVAVGSPIANRNRAETEPLIGFFVNTLVLRGGLGGSPSFGALLRRVRETLLDAYAHQDLPFEKVVEELRPERALSHSPLFQVMLILQNAPLALPRLAGLGLAVEEIAGETAKLDLTLSLAEDEGGLRGQLEYDRDLFDGTTAERLLGHYLTLLAAAVAAPERRAAELELLPAAERAQLLGEWNDTAAPFRRDLCLHERFAAQAARTPRAVALVWGEERISYADLARRANRLAHRLRRLGVGPESRVGVALERTPELVAALLAVLAAGGAYVPLDPAYPRQRLAFLLADAQEGQGSPVLLTERRVLDRLPAFTGAILVLDELDLSAESERAPESGASAENLAYLIYTSGSTGRPKGVGIAHRSAAALLDWASGVFPAAELAGVLAATSVTFDLSVFELFLPLTTGGTVVLADDALALPHLPAAGEVTLINTVPSAMAALVRSGGVPAGVRTVNLAGEALPRALVEEIYALPGVEKVFNLYGPSEDTTYSTWVLVPRGAAREPTIGSPVANSQAHVVDRALGLLPVGVPGELCLGGEGLARGYLNRPELTAERFVPDPFGADGGRLYRAGDLARRRAGGEL